MSHKAKGAMLVGSVPLDSAAEVFETLSEELGDRLKRIPDGETGPRARWIGWQLEHLKRVDGIETVPAADGAYSRSGTLRVKEGVDPASIVFDNLGYADVALESWEIFNAKQQAGEIPAATRFQVSIPPPMATSNTYLREYGAVKEAYKTGLFNEVQRIVDGIPHEKLAIQWDVCVEVWWVEGWVPAPFEPVVEGVADELAACASHVPDGVELGFHFCYGDLNHEHLKEPDDISACVKIFNAMAKTIKRDINWAQFPVPIERDDDAYFEPLRDLADRPECEIFIGLVHLRDGAEGAERRMATAHKFIDDFGVATECGMGRRPEGRGGSNEELMTLLRIHADVTEPVV